MVPESAVERARSLVMAKAEEGNPIWQAELDAIVDAITPDETRHLLEALCSACVGFIALATDGAEFVATLDHADYTQRAALINIVFGTIRDGDIH